jgi:hypothetical protein
VASALGLFVFVSSHNVCISRPGSHTSKVAGMYTNDKRNPKRVVIGYFASGIQRSITHGVLLLSYLSSQFFCKEIDEHFWLKFSDALSG